MNGFDHIFAQQFGSSLIFHFIMEMTKKLNRLIAENIQFPVQKCPHFMKIFNVTLSGIVSLLPNFVLRFYTLPYKL